MKTVRLEKYFLKRHPQLQKVVLPLLGLGRSCGHEGGGYWRRRQSSAHCGPISCLAYVGDVVSALERRRRIAHPLDAGLWPESRTGIYGNDPWPVLRGARHPKLIRSAHEQNRAHHLAPSRMSREAYLTRAFAPVRVFERLRRLHRLCPGVRLS